MKKIHKRLKWRNFINKIVWICVAITGIVTIALATLAIFGTNESVNESVRKLLNVLFISFGFDAIIIISFSIASYRYRKVVKMFFTNKINMVLKKCGEDSRVVRINNAVIDEKYDIYVNDSICYRTETRIRKEVRSLKQEFKEITKNDVQLAVHHFEDGFLFTI